MSTVLATSIAAVAPSAGGGAHHAQLAKLLISLAASPDFTVGVFSGLPKPPWFDAVFGGSGVQFVCDPNRQSGGVLRKVAQDHRLAPHRILILSAKAEDVRMGRNTGAVLVAAGWSTDQEVQQLGISVADTDELAEVVRLTDSWTGGWWFSGQMPHYSVRALADLSQFYQTPDQQMFAKRLKLAVKQGSTSLTALLSTTTKSLLSDGLATERNLMWGVYPSSRSSNSDDEILSDFTHRLRTAGTRVHFAKRGAPLFLRHQPTIPRHTQSSGAGRLDPATQIESICVNPEYRGRMRGRRVMVIDDCTTYGISFAVAAALLRRAGAAAVDGVAVGQFGRQLSYLEIEIDSDPFLPIPTGAYRVTSTKPFAGTTDGQAQALLRTLLS